MTTKDSLFYERAVLSVLKTGEGSEGMKKQMKRIVAAVAFALALSLVVPVGIGLQSGLLKTTQAATSIKKTLVVGQTLQLQVTGTSQKVKWSSNNKKVAKVGKKGLVRTLSAGKATITAKTGNQKLTCTVTVKSNGMKLKPKSPIVTGVYDMGQFGPATCMEMWATKIWYTGKNTLKIQFHINNTTAMNLWNIGKMRGVYIETYKGDVLVNSDPVILKKTFDIPANGSKNVTFTFTGKQVKKFVNLRKAGGIRFDLGFYMRDEWYQR